MCSFFCFLQFEASTADNNFMAVFDKSLDHILQVQLSRTTVDQGDIVYTERRLQCGQLIQFIQYDT